MPNKRIIRIVFPIILWPLLCHGLQEYSLDEAVKVIGLIDQIQREQGVKRADDIRRIKITESEFNSYVAHRIKVEQEEVLRELRFKLLDKNKIEVMAVVDLSGQDLPKILKPKMTFFFGGRLEVRDNMIRLDLKDLFLENQRIQPMVLDLVIFIASKIQNTVPASIEDWYELPYGIKEINTRQGCATFYY